MRKMKYSLALAASLTAAVAIADTLELADGTLLEGDFVGSSNGIIMFNTGAGIEAFPESEVVGIFISSGVETRQREQAAQAAPQAQTPPPPAQVTIPNGTRLVLSLIHI